ncbi:MAG: hypothetical protein ACLFUB_18535 [Cyclobacteriaceae bacterium]
MAFGGSDNNKVIGRFNDQIEEGNFEFFIQNDLVKKGKYVVGQKIGLWDYFIGPDNYRIEWMAFNSNEDSLSVSLPGFWEYKDVDEALFLADVTPDKREDRKKFFLIQKHSDTSPVLNLDEVAGSFYSVTSKTFVIKKSVIYKVIVGGHSYYYFDLRATFEDEEFLIFTLLTERNNDFYELSLIHDSLRARIKEIIFFDIVYNTFIGGERVISPYQKPTLQKVNFSSAQ